MMRESYEYILSCFKEGVIVVDRNTGLVMFANNTAKRVNKCLFEKIKIPTSYLPTQNQKDENPRSIYESKAEQFAVVDKQKLNDATIDAATSIEYIN